MDPTWTSVSSGQFAMIQICLARFPLSTTKDKHITMQISLKCKYHIYMLDLQLPIRVNITGAEGEKPPGKETHLSLLSLKLTLMSSLPSGHRRGGRAGTSSETVNSTNCLFLHLQKLEHAKSTNNHFRKLFKE